MKQESNPKVVYFSVKGQVVIPRWLRREFDIEEGTRAHVVATPQGILIRPITARHIRSLRGSLKGSGSMTALESDRGKDCER